MTMEPPRAGNRSTAFRLTIPILRPPAYVGSAVGDATVRCSRFAQNPPNHCPISPRPVAPIVRPFPRLAHKLVLRTDDVELPSPPLRPAPPARRYDCLSVRALQQAEGSCFPSRGRRPSRLPVRATGNPLSPSRSRVPPPACFPLLAWLDFLQVNLRYCRDPVHQ